MTACFIVRGATRSRAAARSWMSSSPLPV